MLALATAALAQPAGPPTPAAAPKAAAPIPAIDPATLTDLPAARAYRPPKGIAFKIAEFTSEGVRLTAQWLYLTENDGQKLPTVIMAPGWGATAASLRPDAEGLAKAGYLVMLFDYRGWGESEGRVVLRSGRPAAGGTFAGEVRELRGAIDPWEQSEDWLNAISYAVTEQMVDAGRIGLLGADLAGGHVVYAAAHDARVRALVSQVSRVDLRPYKPYQADPAKVIAEADAAASRLANGEALPATGAVGAKVVRWAPVERADSVKAAALFVLAQDEELFSNQNNGQKACERVQGPRKLMVLPKITHYGVYGPERARALNAAIDWFDRFLKPPGAPTRVPINPKAPERGECNPPPEPPKGEEDPVGEGENFKVQNASGRYN